MLKPVVSVTGSHRDTLVENEGAPCWSMIGNRDGRTVNSALGLPAQLAHASHSAGVPMPEEAL